MLLPVPLLRGQLLRRYQRFFADVRLHGGDTVTAHCANSGSMRALLLTDQPVALSRADNPERKLRFTWEMIQVGRTWVGVHTGRANAIVARAVEAQAIPELRGYRELTREVRYGRNSRIDLLLTAPRRRPCYVEVKSVTLAAGRLALFPDAVTDRGRKHLLELCGCVRRGQRAVLFFLVQRADCDAVAPAELIDPAYARALRRAARAGVEILAYRARVSPRQIRIERRLPVELAPILPAPL